MMGQSLNSHYDIPSTKSSLLNLELLPKTFTLTAFSKLQLRPVMMLSTCLESRKKEGYEEMKKPYRTG